MLTHPNHVSAAADQQCCLLPTARSLEGPGFPAKLAGSNLWQPRSFWFQRFQKDTTEHYFRTTWADVCCVQKVLEMFLFQNRTTVLPLIQPQNHSAHGMDMLAFDQL